MIKSIFFLVVVVAVVSAETTPVKRCRGVKLDLFKSVVVSTYKGVCTKLPCQLISGKDVVVKIKFDVREEVSQIKMNCNATTAGLTIGYHLPNATKGCDYLTNTKCPIKPNTEAELQLTMNVLKIFPLVPVDLVFFLEDQNKKMISCFEVLTKVVKE